MLVHTSLELGAPLRVAVPAMVQARPNTQVMRRRSALQACSVIAATFRNLHVAMASNVLMRM
jgi:hypothetical protein